jgi:hypothetical protein
MGTALMLEARQGRPFMFRSAASWAGAQTRRQCFIGRVRLFRGLGIVGYPPAKLATSFPRGPLSLGAQIKNYQLGCLV